jgi:four helix bundle protein
MAIIWKELGYIKEENFTEIKNLSTEISKMLSWYIKSLK